MTTPTMLGFVGNLTFPWLCSAVSVSLLFLGAVCLVMELPPRSLPPRVSVLTVTALLLVYGVGLVVDGLTYHPRPHDWKATVAGWIGFAVILSGVFGMAHL